MCQEILGAGIVSVTTHKRVTYKFSSTKPPGQTLQSSLLVATIESQQLLGKVPSLNALQLR
jgi:hypothetical protein